MFQTPENAAVANSKRLQGLCWSKVQTSICLKGSSCKDMQRHFVHVPRRASAKGIEGVLKVKRSTRAALQKQRLATSCLSLMRYHRVHLLAEALWAQIQEPKPRAFMALEEHSACTSAALRMCPLMFWKSCPTGSLST